MTRRKKDERKMYFVTFILSYGEAARKAETENCCGVYMRKDGNPRILLRYIY